MAYLSPTQVKNILAKAGIPRGKKTKDGFPQNGVVTHDCKNGWVMVDYDNPELATKDGIGVRSHNRQMFPLIAFVLKEMNGFEYEVIEHAGKGNLGMTAHYFRKETK